jgi:hypothetical protein
LRKHGRADDVFALIQPHDPVQDDLTAFADAGGKMIMYAGTGSIDVAANFVCQDPPIGPQRGSGGLQASCWRELRSISACHTTVSGVLSCLLDTPSVDRTDSAR